MREVLGNHYQDQRATLHLPHQHTKQVSESSSNNFSRVLSERERDWANREQLDSSIAACLRKKNKKNFKNKKNII